jgi:protein involved in temperature-dependent protein secretion
MVDFKKALNLIETAHKIDPAYCDVHQQYGHVYFQQGRYIPFEEAMVQSLMCPFTMGQAMTNWKKYWNAVLTPRNGVTDTEARKRYDGYMKRIEESIAREAKKAADEDYDRRLSGGGSDDGVYYFEDEL